MLSVSNLEFTYKKSNTKALKGLNFEIGKGEIFGFLGPNGAGKTTTQRLIIGLLEGYCGSIVLMGKERREWNNEFFENIGVTFDFPNLYLKLTAAENLNLIKSYYKRQCEDTDTLLERVGLLNDKDKKVESFSKGMKMRLNFIRATMHNPDILFLDEPISGLDPVNARIIKEMILDMKKRGKTVFLTTHNMTNAEQLCDRVAFIVDGIIPVIDSPKELKVKHGSNVVKVEYLEGGSYVTDDFPLDTMAANSRFFEVLKTKPVKTIHSQEATLEDIFIKLTGRELL